MEEVNIRLRSTRQIIRRKKHIKALIRDTLSSQETLKITEILCSHSPPMFLIFDNLMDRRNWIEFLK